MSTGPPPTIIIHLITFGIWGGGHGQARTPVSGSARRLLAPLESNRGRQTASIRRPHCFPSPIVGGLAHSGACTGPHTYTVILLWGAHRVVGALSQSRSATTGATSQSSRSSLPRWAGDEWHTAGLVVRAQSSSRPATAGATSPIVASSSSS